MIEQYFAELDTDKIIREKYFKNVNPGIMVEVGAATPEYLSMSRHFKLNGWRCVVVEPNPKFVNQHKDIGNEVYQYACSNEDKDNVEFEIVHNHINPNGELDDHAFSSFKVDKSYIHVTGVKDLQITKINVNVRKLNTILEECNIQSVDLVSVDVEGWELEVMKGLDANKYNPKVIVLENYIHKLEYNTYMESIGYKLDTRLSYNYIYTR